MTVSVEGNQSDRGMGGVAQRGLSQSFHNMYVQHARLTRPRMMRSFMTNSRPLCGEGGATGAWEGWHWAWS